MARKRCDQFSFVRYEGDSKKHKWKNLYSRSVISGWWKTIYWTLKSHYSGKIKMVEIWFCCSQRGETVGVSLSLLHSMLRYWSEWLTCDLREQRSPFFHLGVYLLIHLQSCSIALVSSFPLNSVLLLSLSTVPFSPSFPLFPHLLSIHYVQPSIFPHPFIPSPLTSLNL